MRFVRSISPRLVGDLTAGWGFLFAVVHAYWAAGGAAGMDGEPAGTAARASAGSV